MLPASAARQLAGTLREQLAHLRIDVARITKAAALRGDGLQGADRMVLVILGEARDALRPREIEERGRVSKTAVAESLKRLEHRGRVRRLAVPSPNKVPAWAWKAL